MWSLFKPFTLTQDKNYIGKIKWKQRDLFLQLIKIYIFTTAAP